MKPLVLIIENAVAITGSVKSAMRSCNALENEFEFSFIVPTRSLAKSFVERAGFRVYEMPFLEISKSWKSIFYLPILLFNVFLLRKIISRSKTKLIIVNDFYNMLPAIYKLFGGRTPYITFVRFVPSRFPKALVNAWCFFHFRFSEKIIAVSESVYKHLKPHSKLILVYSELPKENGYKFYPIDINSKIILYVSNYIPGKGQEYAVQAFSSLGDEFSDWTMRFVGSDMGLKKNKAYKKELLTLSERLSVSHKIVWEDFIEDVVEEYKRASLVLNFSDSESFSLTCIEALYIGRAVIATKCGGPEEIITSGVTGELVEVRNQEQMVRALKKLLSDETLRRTYGEQGHVSVSEKFSLENTTYKLRPIFIKALNKDHQVSF